MSEVINFNSILEERRALAESKRVGQAIKQAPVVAVKQPDLVAEAQAFALAQCNTLIESLQAFNRDLQTLYNFCAVEGEKIRAQNAAMLTACAEIENAPPDQLEAIIARVQRENGISS